MSNFRADLHSHTSCSDGTFTPEELVRHAAEKGLSGLSITDHDTVEAYAEALPVAQEVGIELLPGVEFSSRHGKESVHILGYGFDLKNRRLLEFCRGHITRRVERNREILRKLADKGMVITEEEIVARCGVEGKEIYGRPHIAQVMVDKGFVKDIRAAFNRWIGDTKPCFALGKSYTVEETLDVIHEAGGKGVIAHPHLIQSGRLLNHLLTCPFDGIEGFYASFDRGVEEKWIRMGEEKGWIITGGSDFHGTIKPGNPLGASWVTREVFDALRST